MVLTTDDNIMMEICMIIGIKIKKNTIVKSLYS